MKIYIVGHQGPEHQWVEGVYRNKDDALKAFEAIRLELLDKAKDMLEYTKRYAKEHLEKGTWFDGKKFTEENIAYFKKEEENGGDIYLDIIKCLGEKDPDKIDNYPQETPYIREMELK